MTGVRGRAGSARCRRCCRTPGRCPGGRRSRSVRGVAQVHAVGDAIGVGRATVAKDAGAQRRERSGRFHCERAVAEAQMYRHALNLGSVLAA
eukprot:360762-Chlamydomonas_euryale.AAC.2